MVRRAMAELLSVNTVHAAVSKMRFDLRVIHRFGVKLYP